MCNDSIAPLMVKSLFILESSGWLWCCQRFKAIERLSRWTWGWRPLLSAQEMNRRGSKLLLSFVSTFHQKPHHNTMSKIPPIEQLSRPEPLHKVLAEQDKLQDDCTPCRLTGKKPALPEEGSRLTNVHYRSSRIRWLRCLQLCLRNCAIKGARSKDS